ncbi:MAG: NAD(P)/FAD-dependent oxidoreductase [Planctomycetota bacterium]|nr:NAD(P)/FAD-dependent oxidoreductase [Planctomycetota bacterium]
MGVIPEQDGARVFETHRASSGNDGSVFDVIVIGAGMGGMSAAAALARLGRRVLLLEQHYLPGGYTHMFERQGFAFDVGVHALGELREKDVCRRMLNYLAEGEVPMRHLGDPYDRFRFPDGFRIDFPANGYAFADSLKAAFPDQADAVTRYLSLARQAASSARVLFAARALPATLGGWLRGAQRAIGRDWWSLTTADVLDEAGVTGQLRTVLAAQWGYIGEPPASAAFPIQALVHSHYANGAWYPVGGSKALAAALVGTVKRRGGRCLVRAEVETVTTDEGRADGVRLADGTEFKAPIVISAAGARTTAARLAPRELRDSPWSKAILELPSSPPYLCLNLGFEGDIAAAGAQPSNLWLFSNWNENECHWNAAEAGSLPHILYVSFPSLKDPEHRAGPDQKHTGECVTFVPWDLFAPFADSSFGQREAAYIQLKEDLTARMVAKLREALPEVAEMIVYKDLSTPLSAEHFVHAHRGAIYGLATTPERFACPSLRARTPVKGFYLSGVDMGGPGVAGAMAAGILTAAAIDARAWRRLL